MHECWNQLVRERLTEHMLDACYTWTALHKWMLPILGIRVLYEMLLETFIVRDIRANCRGTKLQSLLGGSHGTVVSRERKVAPRAKPV